MGELEINKEQIGFVEILGFKIPVHEGDNRDTIINRIHEDVRLPFKRVYIGGKAYLMELSFGNSKVTIEFELQCGE